MFAIIISEKGGAERREAYDKNEINVGRVQGNDLMLPKGNVSKHHARLLFRDGRFIVTDLKSTNGTYVNGRKIAQATIVREGDKIYIGDFVLRLESNGAGGNASVPPPPQQEGMAATAASAGMNAPSGMPPNLANVVPEDEARTAQRDPGANRGSAPLPNVPAVTLKAPTHPPGAAAPLPRPQGQSPLASQAGGSPLGISNAIMSSSPGGASYALDQDPDESAPVQKPRPSAVPPPLGGTGGMRPMTMPLNQMSPPAIGQRGGGVGQSSGGPPPLGGSSGSPLATPPAAIVNAPLHQSPPAHMPAAQPPPLGPAPAMPAVQPPPQPLAPPPAASSAPSMASPGRATAPPPRLPPKETPAQAGRRLALMTLLDRIADAVDLSVLATNPIVTDAHAQEIERAAREQANAMREEGDAPEGIDLDAVVRDAHRELVGLGAFTSLLEDEEVGEIHCVRFDQVFTLRGGDASSVPESTAFSSEEALARVVARLAHQSGDPLKPGEIVVERRLPRAAFVAISPPAAVSQVVSIRKRRRIETTLEELTRSGSASKGMAQFLEACIHARANILVSGNAPLPLLSALAATSSGTGERVVVMQDVEEIGVGNAHVASLSLGDTRTLGEECVRAAAKLRADRMIVTQLTGGVAVATVDAMTEGNDGVLAALTAPTLRQGMSRLVAQLVIHRPGLSLEGMREVLGEAFDIAIEINAFPDGRLRVMRIAELSGADAKGIVARDLFVFNADPVGGDGSFSATGVVPRIANDLAARGTKLDPALFKRAGR